MRFLAIILILVTTSLKAQQWVPLKGPPGGAVTDIELATNGKMYSLANFTVSVSSDNGVNWTQVTNSDKDGFANDLAMSGNNIYGLFGDRVKYSADDGATWALKGVSPSYSGYAKMVTLPLEGGIITATNTEINLSVDGGATWKNLRQWTGSVYDLLDIDVAPNGDIYLSLTSAGLLKFPYPAAPGSHDSWNPAAWATIFAPESTDPQVNVGIAASGRVYVAYQSTIAGRVMKSSVDNGVTWQALSDVGLPVSAPVSPRWAISPGGKVLLFNSNQTSFEFIEANPTPWVAKGFPASEGSYPAVYCAVWRSNIQLFTGTIYGLYQSSNSGLSYSLSNTGINFGRGQSIALIQVGAEKRIIYVQESMTGYYYSNDDGATWTFVNRGHQIDKMIKLPDNTLLMSSNSNPIIGTFTSADGINWTASSTPIAFEEIVIVAANDIYGFTDDGTVYGTVDKGANWTLIPTTGITAGYVRFAARDADGFFYICTSPNNIGTRFLKVDSNVDPWVATEIITPPTSLGMPFVPFSMFSLNGKLYLDQDVKNYYSSDKGATWTRIAISDRMVPVRQNTGAVAFARNGYFSVTQDDGRNIRAITVPSTADIREITFDVNGDAYASAISAPALKYTDDLVLSASQLPENIAFNWTDIPSPSGGSIQRLVASPAGTLYAVADGKLYKYDQSSSTWLLTKRMVNDVHVDASNQVYTSGFNGLGLSTDNGATFTHKPMPTTSGFTRFTKAPSGDIFIYSPDGFFRSTDDGTSFVKTAITYFSDVATAPGGVVIGLTSSSISLSTDNGATWTTPPNIPVGTLYHVSLLDGNNFGLTTSTGLYKTSDGGNTWTPITGNLPVSVLNYSKSRLHYIPSSSQYSFFDVFNFYFSSDQGATWVKKGTVEAVESALWVDEKVFCAGAGVWKSEDGAATFSEFSNGIARDMWAIETFNGSLFSTGYEPKIYASHDRGQTWDAAIPGSIHGAYKTPTALIAYGSAIHKTTDGKVFTQMSTTQVARLTATPNYNVYFAQPIATAGASLVIRSTDLVSWTPLPISGLPVDLYINDMVATDNETLLLSMYAGQTEDAVYRVAAGTATKVTAIPDDESIKALESYKGTLYVATKSALYETSDGLSFTKKLIPDVIGFFSITEYGQFVISGFTGDLWLSRDLGTTWQYSGNGLDTHDFRDVAFDEFTGEAYAVFGKELFQRTNSISVANDKTAPQKASLLPPDNAIDVAVNTIFSIAFNEDVFAVAGKKLKVFTTNGVTPVSELDVTAATKILRTFTFTLPAALTFSSSYYVTFDNGAFNDLFGNAFAGFGDKDTWNITTVAAPDVTPPVIAVFTPTDHEVDSGSKNIAFSVTDTRAISLSSAKLFFKSITATEAMTTAALANTGSATAATFAASLPQAAFGSVGIVFYFEIEDESHNKARSPATANTYHYSYLTYPPLTPPKLPVQPTGGTTESYRIIALPYNFTDNKVSTVFKDLGEPNKEVWRLFRYSGVEANPWTEYSEDDQFTTFERGKGYWININAINQPSLTGAAVPKNNPDNFFTIELSPGWNQIGNPYTVPVSWNETRAQNTKIGQLKIYGSAGYTNGDIMDVHTGGIVYLAGTAPVPVKTRFIGFTSGGKTLTDKPGSDLANATWEIPIAIHQGERHGLFSGIGMNPEAQAGFDQFDDLNPPPFFSILELNFEHPGSSPRRFAKDVVPTQEFYTWEFNVDATQNEIAELRWDNSVFGVNDIELYLFDGTRQALVNMKDEHHYQFVPGSNSRFKIFFGRDVLNNIKPDQPTAGDPYPNPSQSDISFPYTLSAEHKSYRIKVEVIDMMGRPVATIVDGEQPAGFYKATWNPSSKIVGAYIFKLSVSDFEHVETYYRKFILK
jgi:photosystem II stability/assembly factor-like uncharacterized protein